MRKQEQNTSAEWTFQNIRLNIEIRELSYSHLNSFQWFLRRLWWLIISSTILLSWYYYEKKIDRPWQAGQAGWKKRQAGRPGRGNKMAGTGRLGRLWTCDGQARPTFCRPVSCSDVYHRDIRFQLYLY
jgi:hypothetical protein